MGMWWMPKPISGDVSAGFGEIQLPIIYVLGMDFFHKLIVTLYLDDTCAIPYYPHSFSLQKKNWKFHWCFNTFTFLGNPCLFSPFEKSPPQEMKNPLLRGMADMIFSAKEGHLLNLWAAKPWWKWWQLSQGAPSVESFRNLAGSMGFESITRK